MGEASKKVAKAVNQGSSGTRVALGNYGISKGTEGAVGLCSRGVSLIPKEIGRHRGKKSDRFQPEGTAQALTHSPLMINTPTPTPPITPAKFIKNITEEKLYTPEI